jgi:hypothetical protein
VQDFFDFNSKYTTTTPSPQQQLQQQQAGHKTAGHENTFPLGKTAAEKKEIVLKKLPLPNP